MPGETVKHPAFARGYAWLAKREDKAGNVDNRRELLAFLRQARFFVARVLELRVVPDDRLFLLVMFGMQRGHGCVRHREQDVGLQGKQLSRLCA